MDSIMLTALLVPSSILLTAGEPSLHAASYEKDLLTLVFSKPWDSKDLIRVCNHPAVQKSGLAPFDDFLLAQATVVASDTRIVSVQVHGRPGYIQIGGVFYRLDPKKVASGPFNLSVSVVTKP